MLLATRLRVGFGPFSPEFAFLPRDWGFSRFAGNPVIDVADNPSETTEQYVPAPIILPSGDVWVYVKGASVIYAWKSTDGGETFSLENGGSPVIAHGGVGTWDHTYSMEPAAVYDEASGTIHLYYKGFPGPSSTGWSWGHATADDSDPVTFTKDPANPILTAQDVSTHLGGSAVTDFVCTDVIVIGSTFHFYGYIKYGTLYRLFQTTGTTWNDPSVAASSTILNSESTSFEVTNPCVVKMPVAGPDLYVMFYTRGGASTAPPRGIRIGKSYDGETWNFTDTRYIIEGTTGWEANGVYAASVLKETASPYSSPVIDAGTWRYYISGTASGVFNTGLVYMAPA